MKYQRYLAPLLFLSLSAFLVRCGSSTVGDPPTCTGTSCSCPAGTTCDLAGSACEGPSCTLKCADHTTCAGTCGDSCSADCTGGATCNLDVGKSGSVTCGGGSTCHITCAGDCSVSCGGGSTCDLTCAGDTEAKSIPEGGKCSM